MEAAYRFDPRGDTLVDSYVTSVCRKTLILECRFSRRRATKRELHTVLSNVSTHFKSLWCPLLPYGNNYKASRARPGLSRHLQFLTSGHSDAQAQPWESECPDVKNYKWRLNPVWHGMIVYSCTHMATVGVKGLLSDRSRVACSLFSSKLIATCVRERQHQWRKINDWSVTRGEKKWKTQGRGRERQRRYKDAFPITNHIWSSRCVWANMLDRMTKVFYGGGHLA